MGAGATSFCFHQRRAPVSCNTPPVFVTADDLKEKFRKHQPQLVPLTTDKMLRQVKPGTQPVVIVACGSFSPPTNMHLRIFEDAKIALNASGKYTVVGGYMSPVHTAYGKKSLVENHHRVNLVQAALADSSWLMVDLYECCAEEWTPTALVLDKIRQRLADIRITGSSKPIKVMFLCGGDLLESFTTILDNGKPLWAPEHQRIILAENGVACLEREGTDLDALIKRHPVLLQNKANLEVVKPAVANNISSTAVRRELHVGSVKYLIPDAVIDYIKENGLVSKPQWKP